MKLKKKKHSHYAMTISFNKKLLNKLKINNINKIFHNCAKELVIDPLDFLKHELNDCTLCFVNDCRKNINDPKLYSYDKKIRNVQIITGLVNNWPFACMVTARNVRKGDLLWTDYGGLYYV